VIHLTALVLYIIAAALWLRSLLVGGGSRGAGLASGAVTAAVAFHAIALTLFVLEFRQLPLVGLGPALSTLALLLGVALLPLAMKGEVARVGIVVTPLIVVLQGAAMIVGVSNFPVVPGVQGAWFALHVVLALVGYQGLTLAFAAGVLYLIQFKELKSKRLGRLFRFIPPLASLDTMARVGLVVGFASMTLALAIGGAWAARYQGGVDWGNPKLAWAALSWIALGAPLAARSGKGARERRGAAVTVISFVAVVATYLLLRLTPAAGPGFL